MSVVERERQASEDRQVNVRLDALSPAHPERKQCPLVFEVAKLPLNRSMLVVELLRPRRRVRHEGGHQRAIPVGRPSGQRRLRYADLIPVGRCCKARVWVHAGKVEQPRNGPNLPFRSTIVP